MAKSDAPEFRLGEYWLSQRPGRPGWYRTWYDRERKYTRRAALGVTSFEDAKQRLSDWYVREHTPQDEDPGDVLLIEVIRRYYEEHASKLRVHGTARLNLTVWINYFEPASTTTEATKPAKIAAFVKHLEGEGKSASYINRIFTTGRAAINRAWKKGLISSAPFIPSQQIEESEPKGRALSLDELRLLYHSAETEHLKSFILWSAGTAGRPEAVLEMHSQNIDLDHGLVMLNPPGRKQTKKIRPEVKLPSHLKPFVCDGFQITFRGTPVKDVKTAWRNQRKNCNFDARVQPYSLRHTIARHLRASGVPA